MRSILTYFIFVTQIVKPAWALAQTKIPSVSRFYEKAPSLTEAKTTKITL